MTKEQIADILFKTIGEQLYRWTMADQRWAIVLDGTATPFPAGTTREEAERRAAEAGCELVDIETVDGMHKLASAMAAVMLKDAESHVAEAVAKAKGAGKA